jgi:hypothetical protein
LGAFGSADPHEVTPTTDMLDAVPGTAPPERTAERVLKLTIQGPPLEPPVKLLPCRSCPAPAIVVVYVGPSVRCIILPPSISAGYPSVLTAAVCRLPVLAEVTNE